MSIGFKAPQNLNARAQAYHRALSGFLRATLVDHGITSAVINQRQIGWDGAFVTIPVRDQHGRVVFFERWDADRIGYSVDDECPVELYRYDVLTPLPERILIAEGLHEALVFESHGFTAVAATGSGRTFKHRQWTDLLYRIPHVALAYRREDRVRAGHLLSRSEAIYRASRALPQARRLSWPKDLGETGSAYAFFVAQKRTRDELLRLLRW